MGKPAECPDKCRRLSSSRHVLVVEEGPRESDGENVPRLWNKAQDSAEIMLGCIAFQDLPLT